MKLSWIYIICFILLTASFGQAQTCSDLFRSDEALLGLIDKSSVTETQILKAAKKDILESKSLSQRSKAWGIEFLSGYNPNKSFIKELQVEDRRRLYRDTLSSVGVRTRSDLRFLVTKYRSYLQMVATVGINSAANYLSYHFLSTFVVIYIPNFEIFKTHKVSDEVLFEMASRSENEDAPKTKAYISAEWKYNHQVIYKSLRKAVAAGIVSSLAFTYAEVLTSPEQYAADNIHHTSIGITQSAHKEDDGTILILEAKKQDALINKDFATAEIADQMIEEAKRANSK